MEHRMKHMTQPQLMQITLYVYVIHKFGEFAVKFNFITTLLSQNLRDQKPLVPSSSKAGATGPIGCAYVSF